MLFRHSMLRIASLVLALGLGSGGSLTAAAAHSTRQIQPALARFYGEVTSVVAPAGNPTGFTLTWPIRNGHRSLDFHLAPNPTFRAMSAEAEVEGFQVGDWASVLARRVRRMWTAYQVQFDVQPFDQVKFSGTITRVAPNGKRIALRVDTTGEVKVLAINAKTKFKMDGQIITIPPVLSKGDRVQVLARKLKGGGLLALEIDLKTTGGFRSLTGDLFTFV